MMKCGNCKADHTTANDVRACYSAKALVSATGATSVRYKEEHVAVDGTRTTTADASFNLVDLAAEFDSTRPNNRAEHVRYTEAGPVRPYSSPLATSKQIAFITNLASECGVTVETTNLTRSAASAKIDELMERLPQTTTHNGMPGVPAGYYATASRTGNNDLDFWRVDRPTEGRWAGYTFVKRVIGGHEDQAVRGAEARQALEAIMAEGPEQAARRYGQEIGRCGLCNRSLTDAESRAYGIGPDCRSKGW